MDVCIFCGGKSESVESGSTIISKDGISAHQYCLVSYLGQSMSLGTVLFYTPTAVCSTFPPGWLSEAMKRRAMV